jgi:Domain of unknown function (DUF4965)/Domain of unknown function (DUF5127)/Domain of unknown function (DUF1793)/Domain of unknown function (DUF4964)
MMGTDDGGSAPDAGTLPLVQGWSGRAPAVPLVVRGPYLSVWQAADQLPGTWPTFWTGDVKAMTGIARVDQTPYLFLGAPPNVGKLQTASQLDVSLTPNRTTYVFSAGGVQVTVDFISPSEPTDLMNLSIPLGFVFASASSSDGAAHGVSLYFDISGEWAHGDPATQVVWQQQRLPAPTGEVLALSVSPAAQYPLLEINQYPAWGTAVLSTPLSPEVTFKIGQDTVVRSLACATGALDGAVDSDMPRAISDRWPVLGFNFDLGQVGTTPTAPVKLVVGHVRDPAVSYLGTPIPPLWRSYFSTWEEMVAVALDDAMAMRARVDAIDRRIIDDATSAGGAEYASLCDLAWRQAFGGVELVGTPQQPWMLMKEISSDGNVSTVDVVYPAAPVFQYANPYLLRLLLDPLLAYAETGGWPKQFAEHDIGSAYPNARGHNDGAEEDMPIEESANMLLMAAAYLKGADAQAATAYATAHYAILKQWADYLVTNALDPAFQNQTDDFTGLIGHSVNLALKGILGIGAMAQIAQAAGNAADAQSYGASATSLIAQWVGKAQDASNRHLLIAYDQPGTWSLKYNAYFDRALGLNLIPNSVLDEEAAWYRGEEAAFGIPLDPRHTYSKADWEIWTAASTSDAVLRSDLIHEVYGYAVTTSSRVPLSDWYETGTAAAVGFTARPVVGGFFAVLAAEHKSLAGP